MGKQKLIDDLWKLVLRLEEDFALFESGELCRRMEALDLLDAAAPDVLLAGYDSEPELARRAGNLRARLEAANECLYESMRDEIRRGQPESLLRWARTLAADEDDGAHYGFLDELINGAFRFGEPDGEPSPIEPDMVAYQPTPARHIFNLIDAVELTAGDVLIDLGSGLGHVAMLVSICTPAHSIGIELERSYVRVARHCAQRLNLSKVTFLEQDVREADLSAGTVFFLYTPFTGAILRTVLDRLRHEARRRPIRICSYGPCTPLIAQELWLETNSELTTDHIVLFRSRVAS